MTMNYSRKHKIQENTKFNSHFTDLGGGTILQRATTTSDLGT